MPDLTPSLVREAVAGDREALRTFVDAMTPVIQARAVRGLLRGRALRDKSRDVHQEVADVTQDVFCALFAHGGRALKAWDPIVGCRYRTSSA